MVLADRDEAALQGRDLEDPGMRGEVGQHGADRMGREACNVALAAPRLEVAPIARVGDARVRGLCLVGVGLGALGELNDFNRQRLDLDQVSANCNIRLWASVEVHDVEIGSICCAAPRSWLGRLRPTLSAMRSYNNS